MAEAEEQVEFNTDIDLYEKGRPEYTRESVEFLLDQVGALNSTQNKEITILELGTGTGKFTSAMVRALNNFDCKARLVASDPMPSMCEKFRRIIPEVEIMQFPAEDIQFPDGSVDVVISAQGFHWFANNKSVSEINRVLAPGGKFGMIWNSRDFSVPWVVELQAVIEPCFTRDKTPNNLDNKWKDLLNSSPLFKPVEGNTDFRLFQEGGIDDIVSAIMCLSAVSQSSASEREDIETRVRDILTNHPDLKGISHYKLPYVTLIYWCAKNLI